MRLFIAAIAIVIGGALAQNVTPQQKTKPTHHQNPGESSTSDIQPLPTNIPSGPISEIASNPHASNEHEQAQQTRQPWWQRPSVTDWILATTTLAYSVVTVFILLAIRRESSIARDTADAAIKNAEAAASNVAAMVESNNINREAMQRGQRAYVWFSPVKPLASGSIDKERNYELTGWRLQLRVENSGNTPTKDLRMHFSWVCVPNDLPENFTYEDKGKAVDHPLMIGPKSGIFTGPMEISNVDIQKVRVGKLKLYFYGWATYYDVFENTPLHRTEFCFEASPKFAIDTKDLKLFLNLRFHQRHNSHT